MTRIAVLARNRYEFERFLRFAEPKEMFVDISISHPSTWLSHEFHGLIRLDGWEQNDDAGTILGRVQSSLRRSRPSPTIPPEEG